MRALGIDIGTTTISAVVVERKTKSIERAYTLDNDSFIETENSWEKIQDPEAIITKALKLVDEIWEQYEDIDVIGLTGQMHGIVYINKDGECISPLYTWQDQRGNLMEKDGESICTKIEQQFGGKAFAGYGGITHLYNQAHKLVPEEATSICTIMDYLGMVLTGRKTPLMHISNAASLGIYDVEKQEFKIDVYKKMGSDPHILPEVTDEFTVIGNHINVPVCVAIGDNQASFMGAIKSADETVVVNVGTGGQISVLSDKYVTGKEIEARPLLKDKYLLVGSSLCGGRAYASLEKFYRSYAEAMGIKDVDHYQVMENLMRNAQKQENPLEIITSFSGTREIPTKRGTISNIGVDNFTPTALTFGILEGMAQEVYSMYTTIKEGMGKSHSKMIASGNGIRRNIFLQNIMSKKLEMSLEMAEHEEEAAFGCVVAAMIGTGMISLKDAIGIKE